LNDGFEFDTCVRHNLPVIAVVGTNTTWGQVRYGQISRYGKARGDISNVLLPTRYDRIVEGMGGYGEHVTQPKDIRPALERARASGKPACVNVMVDPDVYSPTTLRNTFYKYQSGQPKTGCAPATCRTGLFRSEPSANICLEIFHV
jgi:acetolactate synthase-1/2/3 large subunit